MLKSGFVEYALCGIFVCITISQLQFNVQDKIMFLEILHIQTAASVCLERLLNFVGLDFCIFI